MIDLSISILTTNNRSLLQNCLYSIYQNTKHLFYEIYVVDSGSTDGTIEMLIKEYPDVNIIYNDYFPGFSAANNQVLKQISGRYAMILNDDTIIKDGALFNMVEFMDSNPDVGAVGPQLFNQDGSHQTSSYVGYPTIKTEIFTRVRLFNYWWKWKKSKVTSNADYFDQFGYYNGNQTEIRSVKHLMGACILVRQEVLHKIGLLDENFFLSYEDQDWCKRIHGAGWQVIYFPEAKVIHLGNRTVSKLSNSKEYISDSQLYFYRKHFGLFPYFLLKLIKLHNLFMNQLIKSIKSLVRLVN